MTKIENNSDPDTCKAGFRCLEALLNVKIRRDQTIPSETYFEKTNIKPPRWCMQHNELEEQFMYESAPACKSDVSKVDKMGNHNSTYLVLKEMLKKAIDESELNQVCVAEKKFIITICCQFINRHWSTWKRHTTLSATTDFMSADFQNNNTDLEDFQVCIPQGIDSSQKISKLCRCCCSNDFLDMTVECVKSKLKMKWHNISLNELCSSLIVPTSTNYSLWKLLSIQCFLKNKLLCNSENQSKLSLILVAELYKTYVFVHCNIEQIILLFQFVRKRDRVKTVNDTFSYHATPPVDFRTLQWHTSNICEDVCQEICRINKSKRVPRAEISVVSMHLNYFDICFQNVSLNNDFKKPIACYYSPVDSQLTSLWAMHAEKSQSKKCFVMQTTSGKSLTETQLKTCVTLKFQLILSECQILVQTITKPCEHSFARDTVERIKISVASGLQVALYETRQSVNKVHLVQFIDKHFCSNQRALTNARENDAKASEPKSVRFDCSFIVTPCLRKRNKMRHIVNSFLSDKSPVCSLTSKTNPSTDAQHNKSVPTDNGINENDRSLTITKNATKDKKQKEQLDKFILKTALFCPDYLPIPETDITVANVLGQIFRRMSDGSNPGPEETMKYELLRLCTLRNYPKEDKPFLIRLAAAGFYYAANGDEVVCYCCGVRRHGWTAQCVPMSVHKRLSPQCPFLTRNSEVNVPVPEETPKFMNRHPLLRQLIEEEEDEGYDTDISAVLQPGCQFPRTIGNGPASNGQGLPNTVSAATSRNIAPKHPHYGVKNVRINSFVGWPEGSCQEPEVLAEAGFYYAGIGDCVRCFQCGVGLRHWAAEDDPWVEHARWTLNNPCPYLILRKGEEFVSLVRMAVEIVSTDSNSAPQQDANAIVPQEADSEHNSPVAKVTTQDSTAAKTQTKTELANTNASSAGKANVPKNNQTNKAQSTARRQTVNRHRSNGSSVQAKGSLTEEQRRIARENDLLRRQNLCCVCFERDVCIVFLPCCHLVTCAECAPALRICPVEKCRKVVKGTVKTFMS